MNKKTFRNRKHKRTVQRKPLPEIVGDQTLAASPELVSALIEEHGQSIMSLHNRVSACVAEELAEIMAHEKQKLNLNQSLFLKITAGFKSLLAGKHPKPELNQTVQNAYACADKFIEDIGTDGLACRNGCNWCCTFKVALSIPEALYIARYLEDSLSTEDFIELKEKIAQTARQVAGMPDKERKLSRIFCPLLVDGSCSIYRARPLTCRGYNSSDESACKRNYSTGYDVNIPYKFIIKESVFNIFYALSTGAKLNGLQSDAVELITALDFIFKNPDAEKRWLRREKLFPPEVVMPESFNP